MATIIRKFPLQNVPGVIEPENLKEKFGSLVSIDGGIGYDGGRHDFNYN